MDFQQKIKINNWHVAFGASHCLILLLLLLLNACSTSKLRHPPRSTHLQKVTFAELHGWHNDEHSKALREFRKSCMVLLKRDVNSPVSPLTHLGGNAGDWHPPCLEATMRTHLSDHEARLFFEKWFVPYAARDKHGKSEGTFTGYYEIELNGSLKPDKRYKYPIYRAPPQINKYKGKPSFTRAAINRGILAKQKLEIAWVDNHARLFLLHIQGSGIVKLPKGKDLKVSFDDHNGFAFRSIHPLLVKHMGKKAHSTPDLLQWLEENPKLGRKIMEHNPSYAFFRPITGRSPIGGQGLPLQGERSIAIDARLYPYGAPIWVQTKRAGRDKNPNRKYHRLFVAQDTGGAIKGAVRADIFFGRGHNAELLASSMRHSGVYYILFPKTAKIPKVYRAYH